MSRLAWIAACSACAAAAAELPSETAPSPGPTIVHLALPSEAEQRFPVAIPTEADATLELDFPWPVADWAGRGFTPDPGKYTGDFIVDAARGKSRMFVTPVAGQARRLLHVVLAPRGADSMSVPLEFLPAPPGLSWTKVLFADPGNAPDGRIRLSPEAPRSRFREPSPDTEIGLIRTMRLLLNRPGDLARGVAEANPSLHWAPHSAGPRSFGDFTLALRFALRDEATDSLGLCVDAANATDRRLIFDPKSWLVRAGGRVYPVQTADFAAEIEPGQTQTAFLVVARGPDGAPTRLLPENDFAVSVALAGSVNPRPVRRFALETSNGK